MITKVAINALKLRLPWLSEETVANPKFKAMMEDLKIPVEREVAGINKGTDALLAKANAEYAVLPDEAREFIDPYIRQTYGGYATIPSSGIDELTTNILKDAKNRFDRQNFFLGGGLSPLLSLTSNSIAWSEKEKILTEALAKLNRNKTNIFIAKNPEKNMNSMASNFNLNRHFEEGAADTLYNDAMFKRHEALEAREVKKVIDSKNKPGGTLFIGKKKTNGPFRKTTAVGSHMSPKVLIDEAQVTNKSLNRDLSFIPEVREASGEVKLLNKNLPEKNKQISIYGNKRKSKLSQALNKLPFNKAENKSVPYLDKKDYSIITKNSNNTEKVEKKILDAYDNNILYKLKALTPKGKESVKKGRDAVQKLIDSGGHVVII